MFNDYVLVYRSLVNAVPLAAGSKRTQHQITQILGYLSKWIPCDILESNLGHFKYPCCLLWGEEEPFYFIVFVGWFRMEG